MQETRQQKLDRLTDDAMKRLATRTTKSLIEIWEMLDLKLNMTRDKAQRAQIYLVFQWINTELEKRNAEAWYAYLGSGEDTPRKFFL